MGYRIGIGDLAGNALIETIEGAGRRMVAFSELDEYGKAVAKAAGKDGVTVVFSFGRDDTARFLNDCSDMMDIRETPSGTYVSLRDGFSSEDLRTKYRIRIALDLLKAFVSNEARAVLLGES